MRLSTMARSGQRRRPPDDDLPDDPEGTNLALGHLCSEDLDTCPEFFWGGMASGTPLHNLAGSPSVTVALAADLYAED